MMTATSEDGITTIRLGHRTWLKLAGFVVIALWGFAQFQCSRIDKIGIKVQELHMRMQATEKNVAEIRNDYRDLNAFLRTRAQAEVKTDKVVSPQARQ